MPTASRQFGIRDLLWFLFGIGAFLSAWSAHNPLGGLASAGLLAVFYWTVGARDVLVLHNLYAGVGLIAASHGAGIICTGSLLARGHRLRLVVGSGVMPDGNAGELCHLSAVTAGTRVLAGRASTAVVGPIDRTGPRLMIPHRLTGSGAARQAAPTLRLAAKSSHSTHFPLGTNKRLPIQDVRYPALVRGEPAILSAAVPMDAMRALP